MNVRRVCPWCLATALVALSAGWGCNQVRAAQPDQPPAPPIAEQGTQVLTRGPVHEAFAETVTFDPEPGIVVTKGPPAAIEELPPPQRLAGANVAWIPGYWAWDDERSDFLWVSGIWRNLPPGRQWVPGYWAPSGANFQWTSGYWADASVKEIEYLPEPPATAEAGPTQAAASADQTWLPGSWVWQQNRYAWRPGFWAGVQPNWVWIPAHYVHAPRGYVFVDGYWDYSVGRRGVLFAPVRFAAGTYTQPGFSYSPATVIDLGAFVDNLFMRPSYQHYYFGDYYAASYQDQGYYPSYSVNSGRFGYDPFFAHERWQHRQDGQWEQNVAATFQNRRDHEEARPPRIWANQGVVIGGGGIINAVRNIVGASLDQAAQNRNGAWRFEPVDQAERQRLGQQGQDVYRFRDQRQQWENQAAVIPANPARRGEPARVNLPPSPIAARSPEQLGQEHLPPKIHAAPPLDNVVHPKPRVNHAPEQARPHTVLRVPLDTPQAKPQPKVERPAAPQSKPQPKAERVGPPSRDNRPVGPPAAGPKPDEHKGKGKE